MVSQPASALGDLGRPFSNRPKLQPRRKYRPRPKTDNFFPLNSNLHLDDDFDEPLQPNDDTKRLPTRQAGASTLPLRRPTVVHAATTRQHRELRRQTKTASSANSLLKDSAISQQRRSPRARDASRTSPTPQPTLDIDFLPSDAAPTPRRRRKPHPESAVVSVL